MRKGVILEINDLYLTLLTPEGEFLRARKLQQDYQVGEEIHFFPETLTVKKKRFNLSFLNSFKTRSIAVAAVFMLAMTALVPVYQNGQVYAYMSIDVNPSIELAVNDDLKVLRMTGYNSEGEEIIGEIKGWKKKDAAVVAEMIIEEIEDEGFLKENKDVVIATVHNKKAKESVDRALEKKITEIKKTTQDENLNFKVMEATIEDREKAQKQGVTTGVYKEKQKDALKPAGKPDEKEKAKPEPEKKNSAPSVVPQPEKKEPPGQEKKKDPQVPKENPNKVEPPAQDKAKGNNNSGKNDNGQDNNKNWQGNNNTHANNGNSNKNGQSRKQYKDEKKSSNQQGTRSDSRGQSGKNKDNPGKK
ncbi:anti-sigma factor domain-containing protein [Bacillus sp. ISL-37]|jgi:outer membrane biosynthesis protein TonB|uniref:anti-sigma factor domain-containing protein n=1 Tax=Bacillus sp. ISL-37 TaxID=2819123 RepID=UPI001BE9D49B|nr:anti-sigma factor domain-containing protein [Bacillus sp. ISL-37]MBT2683633.1 anti-sigma factor domain-containing protein [Bacillus sp. ISL-37]